MTNPFNGRRGPLIGRSMTLWSRIGVIPLLMMIVSLSGCGESEVTVRRYQEKVVDAPPPPAAPFMDHAHGEAMQDIPMPLPATPPAASTEFSWETPPGWREEAGFGMRLATLWIEDGDARGECTLIVLSGQTGSLEANVVRWMGQVNITPPPGPALQNWLENRPTFTTAGGHEGVLVDFDEFVTDPDALSTLGGIIQSGQDTLFVKLTGPKSLLAQERDRFVALCESVQ